MRLNNKLIFISAIFAGLFVLYQNTASVSGSSYLEAMPNTANSLQDIISKSQVGVMSEAQYESYKSAVLSELGNIGLKSNGVVEIGGYTGLVVTAIPGNVKSDLSNFASMASGAGRQVFLALKDNDTGNLVMGSIESEAGALSPLSDGMYIPTVTTNPVNYFYPHTKSFVEVDSYNQMANVSLISSPFFADVLNHEYAHTFSQADEIAGVFNFGNVQVEFDSNLSRSPDSYHPGGHFDEILATIVGIQGLYYGVDFLNSNYNEAFQSHVYALASETADWAIFLGHLPGGDLKLVTRQYRVDEPHLYNSYYEYVLGGTNYQFYLQIPRSSNIKNSTDVLIIADKMKGFLLFSDNMVKTFISKAVNTGKISSDQAKAMMSHIKDDRLRRGLDSDYLDASGFLSPNAINFLGGPARFLSTMNQKANDDVLPQDLAKSLEDAARGYQYDTVKPLYEQFFYDPKNVTSSKQSNNNQQGGNSQQSNNNQQGGSNLNTDGTMVAALATAMSVWSTGNIPAVGGSGTGTGAGGGNGPSSTGNTGSLNFGGNTGGGSGGGSAATPGDISLTDILSAIGNSRVKPPIAANNSGNNGSNNGSNVSNNQTTPPSAFDFQGQFPDNCGDVTAGECNNFYNNFASFMVPWACTMRSCLLYDVDGSGNPTLKMDADGNPISIPTDANLAAKNIFAPTGLKYNGGASVSVALPGGGKFNSFVQPASGQQNKPQDISSSGAKVPPSPGGTGTGAVPDNMPNPIHGVPVGQNMRQSEARAVKWANQ